MLSFRSSSSSRASIRPYRAQPSSTINPQTAGQLAALGASAKYPVDHVDDAVAVRVQFQHRPAGLSRGDSPCNGIDVAVVHHLVAVNVPQQAVEAAIEIEGPVPIQVDVDLVVTVAGRRIAVSTDPVDAEVELDGMVDRAEQGGQRDVGRVVAVEVVLGQLDPVVARVAIIDAVYQ